MATALLRLVVDEAHAGLKSSSENLSPDAAVTAHATTTVPAITFDCVTGVIAVIGG
ncbi:hypothetical protein JK176_03965 [Gluconobacter sp. Dm-73]|uniref:hypothetical protein n=1 Tax=Gluconobacter sp. Dm-73 TaxID=2799802 RepID=UPI001B8D8DAA|nr:hypothetical protein [Gluconobacter sp. Dm-73]MBS1074031.1 hypothetical protein [Gluconobacter sp. Dm-73]